MTLRTPSREADKAGVTAADRELEEQYRALRDRLVGRVARDVPWLARDEVEELYNVAWLALWRRRQAGEAVESVPGFLATVMRRRAADEGRRAQARGQEPALRRDLEDAGELGAPDDLADRMDQRRELALAVEAIRAIPNPETRAGLAHTWLLDRSRAEAAATLDIEPRRFKKLMDRGTKRVHEHLRTIGAGEWCDHLGPLVHRFATGAIDHGHADYDRIRSHVVGCPPCRRRVRAERGLCAALVPVLLAGPEPRVGLLARLAEALAGLASRVTPQGGGSGFGGLAAAGAAKTALGGAGALVFAGLAINGLPGSGPAELAASDAQERPASASLTHAPVGSSASDPSVTAASLGRAEPPSARRQAERQQAERRRATRRHNERRRREPRAKRGHAERERDAQEFAGRAEEAAGHNAGQATPGRPAPAQPSVEPAPAAPAAPANPPVVSIAPATAPPSGEFAGGGFEEPRTGR